LTIRSLLLERPLFRMRAALAPAGPPGAGRLEVPLAASGSSRPWLRVEVLRSGDPVPGGETFLVGSHAERKRDVQTLVFQLECLEAGVRYAFEADPGLEVLDLAPATPLPSLFEGVPSAQDMATFLHQLTHGRRRVPQILNSLARCASPAAAAKALELAARWPAEADPQPLVQALGCLFEERGHRVNPESLEAFCLLVDLERGVGPGISPAAALAVAELFAFSLDQEAWNSNFSQFGSFSEALEGAHEPAATRLLDKLRQQRRTPLDILEDLAGDSQSRRVAAAVRVLKPLLPGGRIRVNEEQLALLPLLQDSGRPVHPETMLALCLFVDLETGDLDRERLEALSTGANTLDTSMYAMVAVAGAFGLELEAFALEPEPGEFEAERVGRLATGSEGGPAGLLPPGRRDGPAAGSGSAGPRTSFGPRAMAWTSAASSWPAWSATARSPCSPWTRPVCTTTARCSRASNWPCARSRPPCGAWPARPWTGSSSARNPRCWRRRASGWAPAGRPASWTP